MRSSSVSSSTTSGLSAKDIDSIAVRMERTIMHELSLTSL